MITSLLKRKAVFNNTAEERASLLSIHIDFKLFGSLSGLFVCFEFFVNYQKRKCVGTYV